MFYLVSLLTLLGWATVMAVSTPAFIRTLRKGALL